MPSAAIVGASTDRSKFGNKALRAYAARGWEVYPVHPKATEIEGYEVQPTIDSLPNGLDRILFYLPPELGITLLPLVKASGAQELWLNPGADGADIEGRAKELGIPTIAACAIVDIGESPSTYS